jgi:hypothetical protein
LIGGLIDWQFVSSNAFGDQAFKRHFVPFNGFAALSISALLRRVQKKRLPFEIRIAGIEDRTK